MRSLPSLDNVMTTGPPVATPIVLFSLFTPLAYVAVVLRFYARRLKGVAFLADDWMILPALFFATAQGVALVVNACIGGLGKHEPLDKFGKAVDTPQLQTFQILEYLSFITFVLALAFAKLSLLHLYLRIFSLRRSHRITVWVIYGINVAWGITFFFGYIWKCNPIPDYWLTANNDGRCLPSSFNYAFAFSNVILDAIILILPLPMVWSLNMRWRQKLVISSIFLLGSFVVYLSIAKAVAFFILFRKVQSDNDIMFDEAPLFYFSVPEAYYAVFSACLPTLRPVLKHWRIPLTAKGASSYYDQYGQSMTVASQNPTHRENLEMKARNGPGWQRGANAISRGSHPIHGRDSIETDLESCDEISRDIESLGETHVAEASEKMSAVSSAAEEDDRRPLRNHIASQLDPSLHESMQQPLPPLPTHAGHNRSSSSALRP